MKKIINKAHAFCKKQNQNAKNTLTYNEAILFAKFGSIIGIKNCTLIASEYSGD